jgi:membrane associated rhomboid family serine protease
MFGRLKFWSVNSWIIAINIAIFVISVLTQNFGVPVLQSWSLPATPGLAEQPQFYTPDGVPASPALQRKAGAQLIRIIVDTATKQKVGFSRYVVHPPLDAWGHFSTQKAFLDLQVWRFVTFQFLHANLLHVAFNMFGLWVFGPTVERYLGGQMYLAFYLVTGIFGGLMYLLLNLLGIVCLKVGLHPLPGLLFEQVTVPLIGASAGVFGVIMACAKIEPDTLVQLIFPPVAIRMKLFAYAFVAIAMLNLLLGGENAGGDAAHVGGAIAGYFFIRNSHLLRDFFDVFKDSRRAPRAEKSWRWGSRAEPIPRADVDRILEKVRQRGIASLTEDEKRILADDTDRLRRRNGS